MQVVVKDNIAHLDLEDSLEGGVLFALMGVRAAQTRLKKIPEEDFVALMEETRKVLDETVNKMNAHMEAQFIQSAGGKLN